MHAVDVLVVGAPTIVGGISPRDRSWRVDLSIRAGCRPIWPVEGVYRFRFRFRDGDRSGKPYMTRVGRRPGVGGPARSILFLC